MIPFPLFPQGALAESVVTCVWLGAMVLIFFNLRLGWSLSGIIVPGYMAPLIILKPVSAVVILVEASVVYGLLRLLWGAPARNGLWHGLFGRDRFLAIIILSIGTRLCFDGWLLPQLALFLNHKGLISPALGEELHSFGLIIIALIANAWWKPGYVRGMGCLLVVLFCTWFLTRFPLMAGTNFTLSNAAYLYEDLASNITGAPKACMLLMAAAWLASRMNLNYGWEYSGIMIPALLALLWWQPIQIVISVLEAFIILGLARLISSLPLFSETTLEGGRKLLLFFNISFGYKLLLAFGLPVLFHNIQAGDYFGYGYMLSTLMALKMHEKGRAFFQVRATLQVSLAAVLLVNVPGYALKWMKEQRHEPVLLEETARHQPTRLRQAVLAEKISLKAGPSRSNLHQANRLAALIAEILKSPVLAFDTVARDLEEIGFKIRCLEKRYLLISERTDAGRGLYLLDTRAQGSLFLAAPEAPFKTLEAGLVLGKKLQARVVAFADERRRAMFLAACQSKLAPQSTLHLRRSEGENWLNVKAVLPDDLHLADLEKTVESLQVSWSSPANKAVVSEDVVGGFAELRLTESHLRRLALSGKSSKNRGLKTRTGSLEALLFRERAAFASADSQAYKAPDAKTLRFLDEEVLQPAAQVAHQFEEDLGPQQRAALELAAEAAGAFGYGLALFQDQWSGDRYLILAENRKKRSRYWGIYLWRMGPARPYQIQVPRPLSDGGAMGRGIQMFLGLEARSLAVAGAHMRANTDGSADPVRPGNKRTLFNLFHQSGSGVENLHPLQIRGYGAEEPEREDVLRAGTLGHDSPQMAQALQFLKDQGLTLGEVDGRAVTAGYEVSGLPQVRYMNHVQGDMTVLWLSPQARAPFRVLEDHPARARRFLALGVETRRHNLVSKLTGLKGGSPPDDLVDHMSEYLRTSDIRLLLRMVNQGLTLERIWDEGTGQAWLLVSNENLAPLLLARLAAEGPDFRKGDADWDLTALKARADLISWRTP